MKVNKKLLSFVVGIFATSLVFTGCHRYKNMDPEAKAEFIVEKVSDKMDFTSDQTAKLEEIANDILTARKDAKAEKKNHKAFLIEQIKGDSIDQERVLELYGQKKQQMDVLAPKVLAKISELHKTLTPEQKTKLVEFIERKMKRKGRHHF